MTTRRVVEFLDGAAIPAAYLQDLDSLNRPSNKIIQIGCSIELRKLRMTRANQTNFYFGENSAPIEPRRILARIPMGIETKQKLLDSLDVGLSFPDYFGGNWDALDECIRDLNWLAPVQIILIHEDLPLKTNLKELETYLSILHDAVAHWDARREHKLLVIFPTECERTVRLVMRV